MNAAPNFAVLAVLGLASHPALAAGPILPPFHLSDFSKPLLIDNPLSQLQPGTHAVFHELEDGECKVNDVVVSTDAKRDFRNDYAGLVARPVSDKVWADPQCDGHRGLLLEDTTDWYGQDDAGNVWYFGERTVEFTYDRAGHRIGASTEGSWEAGRHDAQAGIVMFAQPQVGAFYRQEYSPGVAEDAAKVMDVGTAVATDLGRFRDCIRTRETTALSPGDVEYKFYCPNIGLALVQSPTVDGGATLVEFASN